MAKKIKPSKSAQRSSGPRLDWIILIGALVAAAGACAAAWYPRGEVAAGKAGRPRKQPAHSAASSAPDHSIVGISPSVGALALLLDAHLTTPLAARPPVPVALAAGAVQALRDTTAPGATNGVNAAGVLSAGAVRRQRRETQQVGGEVGPDTVLLLPSGVAQGGTGGGLTALGYALLLHDPTLVQALLHPHNSSAAADPMLPVAFPPPQPPSPDGKRPAPSTPGRAQGSKLLGAFHEAALSDGLTPLHLAMLSKDLVTDAARKFLGARAQSPATADTQSVALETNGVLESSTLGRVLARLRTSSSAQATSVPAAALRAAVHAEAVAPALAAIFASLKRAGRPNGAADAAVDADSGGVAIFGTASDICDGSVGVAGYEAVAVAMRARDRWGRTPVAILCFTAKSSITCFLETPLARSM